MDKSPAAPSNFIHIMKSLRRLKSNGHLHTSNIPKHIPPCRIYCVHRRRWSACESGTTANDLSFFLRLPMGIKIRRLGNKGDPAAVERCREFLLCHRGRTGDNVSTVGINLPHLRAEIKATPESGTSWHQRPALSAERFCNWRGATQWTQRMQGP